MGKRRWISAYGWLRWPLLLLSGAGLLLFAAWRLTQPDILEWDDTVEYWAAGRLNAAGQNPFDPELLLQLERRAGRPLEDPVMMWNPPWLLALIMPLGSLPYALARALWFGIHLVAIFLTSIYAGRGISPPNSSRQALAILLGFSFGPTLHALKTGQITPLMLLGFIGFLHGFHRRRWVMAGTAAALSLIKPHLSYLFLAALMLDIFLHRRWKILLGLIGALVLSSGIATAANPLVWAQYSYAITHYPPRDWATPTLGGLLRFLFGVEHFWLQFLPPTFGLLWLFIYWSQRRNHWQWEHELPLLVLVSVVTAAYGWALDLTLALMALIPALTHLLENRHHPAAIGLMTAYLIVNGISLLTSFPQFFYAWMGPFLLIWYLLAQRSLPQEQE